MTTNPKNPAGAWAGLPFLKSKTTCTPCFPRATKFSPNGRRRQQERCIHRRPAVARVLINWPPSAARRRSSKWLAIGYSTIWWRARWAKADGSSTPTATPSAPKRRALFRSCGVSQRITVRVGDALESFGAEEPYDIIFNDVEKPTTRCLSFSARAPQEAAFYFG